MSYPIVIVGAGAAGIAAARWLQSQQCPVLLLEARERVGGRACTDTTTLGMPIDMGCAWLHSADSNPWTSYAREHDFALIERAPNWQRGIGRELAPPEYQAAWRAAYQRNEALITAAAQAGHDVAVSTLIPKDRFRPLFDAVMTWLMGADSERVSSLDLARYADTDVNWAVPSGLGRVVASAARGLDVRLQTPVRSIHYGSPQVRIETIAGVIEAAAVIVTIPTAPLAQRSIRFTPELPVALQEAFAGVPLGVANKVFFEVAPGALPYEGTVQFPGTDTTSRTATYATRPAGQEVLMAFIGGSLAVELDQEDGLEAFVRAQLGGIFGSDFVRQLRRSVHTRWSLDPWALGSYSVALPGMAHLRERLNQPLEERVFFAGEACSLEYFGTVHGAWFSGVAAAKRALEVCRS